jgi:hypothetical protein
MTHPEEKLADHTKLQNLLHDALVPLLAEDGAGIACLRLFYIARHADGTTSMGQAGLTPEGEVANARKLISNIVTVLLDPEHNAQVQRLDRPDKH